MRKFGLLGGGAAAVAIVLLCSGAALAAKPRTMHGAGSRPRARLPAPDQVSRSSRGREVSGYLVSWAAATAASARCSGT